MRNIIVLLFSSFTLCLAVITGAHASPLLPERKAHPTEYVMHAPTMAVSIIDTVTISIYTAILKPALGPVAPASLVAVDGGTEYLALIRAMTCPPDRARRLVSQLINQEQKPDKLPVDRGR